MAITRVGSFMQIGGVSSPNNSQLTLGSSGMTVGNLVVLTSATSSRDRGAVQIRGGRCTGLDGGQNWTQVGESYATGARVGNGAQTVLTMWVGRVASTSGSLTVTATYATSGSSVIGNCQLDAEIFQSSVSGDVWTVDAVDSLMDDGEEMSYPTLAPSSGSALYVGYAVTNVSGNVGGTTGVNAGFVKTVDTNFECVRCYNLNVTGSVSPTCTQDEDERYITMGALFKAGPAASKPTVSAGPDATIELGGTFDRDATENANGSPILARGWTIVSGPVGAGSSIGDEPELSWTPSVAGVYVLRYAATNAIGAGFDDATITVVGRAGPTRFYLTNSTAPVSPAFTPSGSGGGSGGWDQFDTAVRRAASLTKSGTNTTVAGTENSANTSWDVLLGQWVSPSVVNAGTVQGGYEFMIGRQCSNQDTPENVNLVFHIVIKVVNSAGDTVRGYCDSFAFSTVWPASMQASGGNGPLAEVDAQVGDRIVVEIGFRARNSSTADRSGQMRYGGTDAVDLDLGDSGTGVVTTRSPWIEFSDPVVAALFDQFPPTVDAGLDTPITLGDTFSRVADEINEGPSITSRGWQIVSGPGAGTPLSTSATVSWEPEQGATYVLRYSATNSAGTAIDDVTVTVNDPGEAPTVDAGGDADLAPGDTLTRTADEDDNGSAITSRRWLLVSGPE